MLRESAEIFTIRTVPILLIVEYVLQFYEVYKIKQKIKYAELFTEKVVAYYNIRGNDQVSADWLTKNSTKMQMEMGSFALASYKPAFENYIVHNHQIIINGISEMQQGFRSGFCPSMNEIANSLRESILRYVGYLEEKENIYKKSFLNPIGIFVDGIKHILIIPFVILKLFGIIGGGTVDFIEKSKLIKLIAGVLGLMSILGNIITITTGWDNFGVFIDGLSKKYPSIIFWMN